VGLNLLRFIKSPLGYHGQPPQLRLSQPFQML